MGRPTSLPPRPVMLAGREGLLSKLHARLVEGSDRVGPRIAALYGMGGVGKTSVAAEYAHRHQSTAGIVWQFPAEDLATLAAEFARLAALLGAAGGVMDPRDPVASVHAVLADSPSPWLLVLDNAPDSASLRPFLPPTGNGQVLITSQSSLWPPGQGIEVPVLDVEAAARFLTSRTGDPDGQSAEDLSIELGGLPLALEQASAYIQATGGTLAEYLGLFRRRRADMLARGEPSGYGRTVATTWKVAFGRLDEDAPYAASLLRLLTYLAPEPVPLSLLRAFPEAADGLNPGVSAMLGQLADDQIALSDAVAALRRFSLVAPAGNGLMRVHRLVQAVTLTQMTTDVAAMWRQAAATLIEFGIPEDTEDPAAWPTCAVLLPHAQAVLDCASDGMWRIANYLGHSGSYPAARDMWQTIASACGESLGREHPDTLAAIHNLGYWTGMAGDATAARDLFAGLLPVRERVSGAEHPGILATRHNLARWTGMAGDAAGARDLFAELMPLMERVLGAENPATLADRHSLAVFTGKAGDAAGARDLFVELVPLMERVLGPEHPDALGDRHELAFWTGMAGDAIGARRLFAKLLTVRERVIGAEHPETLATRHNLAQWTGRAGDAAGARDLFAELIPLAERVLGAESPSTVRAMGNLAQWTATAGDAAGARDLFAELLPLIERVLGAEHPETLAARHNLAQCTGRAGDAAGARDLFAELIPLLERVYGPEHPDTLADRYELAFWTRQAMARPAANDA